MKLAASSAPDPREKLEAAERARIVASAAVEEAKAKAPAENARLDAAVRAHAAAVTAANRAASAVVDARRAVANAEDDVTAKEAVADDAVNDPDAKPGKVQTAQAALGKARRALTAAEHALIAAEGASVDADNEVSVCEERVDLAQQEPPVEHSSVLKARSALDAADAAVRRAKNEAAIAEREQQEQTPVPRFASVEAFVQAYVLPNWRHPRGRQSHWCHQWWKHDEAITRLEALWEAFEATRLRPGELSRWWILEFDPHLAALTSSEGTFARCGENNHQQHHVTEPLWPCEPAPHGLFAADPDSPVQPIRPARKGAAA